MPARGPIFVSNGAATITGWMRALRSATALVAALAVVGCSDPSPTNVSQAPVAVCVSGSLDNCYSHDQMQAYADFSIRVVENFYDAVYKAMPHPTGFIFVNQGTTTTQACLGPVTDVSYEFCSADNKVYLGQEMEWFLFHNFGSVGPVVALAHEMGHHAQFAVGIPSPLTSEASIQYENQADCMAGAWVAWASAPGQNYIELPKDLENIAGLMTAIASAEGPGRDHGTSVQRERSFSLGFGGGVAACNDYYPNNPIYGTAPGPS